jgi:hypothetical protein
MPPRLAHKKSRNGCTRCKTRRVKCDENRPECNNCKRHGVTCEFPGVHFKRQRIGASQPIPEADELMPSSPQQMLPTVSPPQQLRPPVTHQFQSITPVASYTSSPPQTLSPQVQLDTPYGSEDTEEDTLDADERRLLENRLLHHFTTIVLYTFPSATNRAIRDMWTLDGVRLAFEHPFLLSTIFATTALHLARNVPESERFYQGSETFFVRSRVMDAPKPSLGKLDAKQIHRFYLNLAVRQQREVQHQNRSRWKTS